MRCIPHPPYLPDLTSSDFYLFATVKEKLEMIQLRQADQLFEGLQEILRGLNDNELNWIFQVWVQ
jgi:hypothetical protein